ncbi:hypothetical protein [Kitasatospora sp. NPDC002965]|uniref:hypothetical protein n=1 Tax=Kitasatospora sp. NPDC002965 TaxID=3154775 RepID=UPI0033BE289D
MPAEAALHPLVLSSVMRARLSAAVRTLLASPGLVGQSDAVRFAAVVLMARTPFDGGVVTIRKGELGRWCGSSRNYMKTVTRTLRGAGLPEGVQATVADVTEDGSEGSADSLSLRVLPLWNAMTTSGGPAGRCPVTGERNPLALDQRELSVLFHLVEYLFAPGWAADPRVGLLASRTGRGAATDRLALLLLVLSASSRGRVRMCGGLVDTHAGRPAVTLARMLGCSPDGAAHVLARLEEAGVLTRPRRGASGLRSRARLMIPAVAAACRAGAANLRAVSSAVLAPRSAPKPTVPEAGGADVPSTVPDISVDEQPAEDRWWERCGEPEVEEPPVADPAVDLEEAFADVSSFVGGPAAATPGGLAPLAAEDVLVSAVEEGGKAQIADLAAATPLHAKHSPVAEVDGFAGEVDGSSGACAVGAGQRRPERAGAREDGPETGLPKLRLVGAADGPLRGEQPNTQLDHNTQAQQGAVPDQPVPYFALPSDDCLARALSPAEDLWVRLTNPSTRDFVLKHVRAALEGIAVWTGAEDAPEALAARLAFRLKRQRSQGNPTVTDPVGWFLKRGLPQERWCSHPACDNGIRTGSDADCNCDLRVQDRRATRRAVIRKVVQQMPGADFEQRQAPIDQALAEHAAHRAAVQVETERRAREEAARWEAQRPEREARAAEAERARLAVPCADCGAGQAGGLCRGCARTREMAEVERECLVVALAFLADLADARSVRQVREGLVEHLASSREFARRGAVDDLIDGAGQIAELGAVKLLLADYRQLAVERFAGSERARAEADAAHGAVMRAAHRYPSKAAAREQAQADAEQARDRAARWLLEQQLAVVAEWLARTEPHPAAPAAGQVGRDAVGADLVRAAVNEHLAAELDLELGVAVRECVDVAVAARAELSVYVSVREVWEQTRQEVRQAREMARAGAAGGVRVQAELSAVRRMIAEYRQEALEWLVESDRAQSAAQTAFDAELRLRAYQGDRAARAGAERAADAACLRVAEQDLARLVAEVQRRRERAGASKASKEG